MEQRVWLTTSSPIYPNLYVILIGHPGTGKTRAIRAGVSYINELPEPLIAPKSLTFASLVDCLVRSKRTIIQLPDPPMEYNATLIAADELGTFMHKYDKEMTDGLSAFFDNDQYSQERRGGEIRIKMKRPIVSMLCGSTPQNLVDTLPESAWGQGFTSRVIMVFSDERIIGDDFAKVTRTLNADMIADLKTIAAQVGEYKVTAAYRDLVNAWRQSDENPKPDHPRLTFYNARRRVNLYKLSMIAAMDRSNSLILTEADFVQALEWLQEAETFMPDIFKASGGAGTDSQAIDEILYFIKTTDAGRGVSEHQINSYARELLPIHAVARVIEIMEKSGLITPTGPADYRTGLRNFRVPKPSIPQLVDQPQIPGDASSL